MDATAGGSNVVGSDTWGGLIKERHTIGGRSSQISRIINELCDSVEDARFANAVDDLVAEIRFAFHRVRPADAKIPEIDFTESPEDFLRAIKDSPDELRDELIASYGTIWLHEAPDVYLMHGEQRSAITRNCLHYQVDNIEVVASRYLKIPGARSLTLEWAIVNALLYSETLAFLQSSAPFQNILAGQGSLKGVSPAKLTLMSFWSFIKEGAKLLLTAVFSLIAGQEDPTAVALIFIAITAARWFIPTHKKRQQSVVSTLAQAMNGAHSLAKRQTFNASVVRHQAYHATTLGAVFSDHVYEILDRRICNAEGVHRTA